MIYQYIIVHTHLCRDNDRTEKEEKQPQLEIHAGRWSLGEWHTADLLWVLQCIRSVSCECVGVCVCVSIQVHVRICATDKSQNTFLYFKRFIFSLSTASKICYNSLVITWLTLVSTGYFFNIWKYVKMKEFWIIQ